MKYRQTIEDIFAMVQKYEDAPPWALGLKLSEETGEFSEVMLHELGFLKHKEKKFEPLVEEAADVINTVIGGLARSYPSKHPRELSLLLLEAINKKCGKYSRILGANKEYFTNE